MLDLKTLKTTELVRGSGAMRWSSTSDKLYFNRDFLNEPDDGCLWVAEFEKAKSEEAATQPAE